MARRTIIDHKQGYTSEFATEDNKHIYHSAQNVQPTIEYAHYLSQALKPGKDMRHVAEIPMVIYQKMVREGSIHDKTALKKWLNNPDNKMFRTWKGKV